MSCTAVFQGWRILALLVAMLWAKPADAQMLFQFNLPRQPLEQSLLAVASSAHVTVAFDPVIIAKCRAPMLRGRYTLRQALDLLLEGSGFRANETVGGSFWVEAVPAVKASKRTSSLSQALS